MKNIRNLVALITFFTCFNPMLSGLHAAATTSIGPLLKDGDTGISPIELLNKTVQRVKAAFPKKTTDSPELESLKKHKTHTALVRLYNNFPEGVDCSEIAPNKLKKMHKQCFNLLFHPDKAQGKESELKILGTKDEREDTYKNLSSAMAILSDEKYKYLKNLKERIRRDGEKQCASLSESERKFYEWAASKADTDFDTLEISEDARNQLGNHIEEVIRTSDDFVKEKEDRFDSFAQENELVHLDPEPLENEYINQKKKELLEEYLDSPLRANSLAAMGACETKKANEQGVFADRQDVEMLLLTNFLTTNKYSTAPKTKTETETESDNSIKYINTKARVERVDKLVQSTKDKTKRRWIGTAALIAIVAGWYYSRRFINNKAVVRTALLEKDIQRLRDSRNLSPELEDKIRERLSQQYRQIEGDTNLLKTILLAGAVGAGGLTLMRMW